MNSYFFPVATRGTTCLLLTFLMLCITTFTPVLSQMADYSITAESLWRNQGYGVKNHTFDIDTYNTNNTTNYPCDPDPTTAACPNEFYTSPDVQLTTDATVNYNTLKINPYSINNAADYRNGVSSLDLSAIAAHINASTLFENRTPTDDWPYRYISADAEYDRDVDNDDIDLLQDLILGITSSVPRDSWSWVHKDEVEVNSVDFYSGEPDMYDYVIDYNWGAPDGIILPSNTRTQIQNDNDKYFTFRTTKTGDIRASSGSSDNDWICGTGTYLTEEKIESRSSTSIPNIKVRKGSMVSLNVTLNAAEEILTAEFMINVEGNKFSVSDVLFKGNFSPKWNYNPAMDLFATSDFNRDISTLAIESGTILKLNLLVTQDIDNLSESLFWYEERKPEFTGMDESLLEVDLRLEVESITPPDLYSELRIVDGIAMVYVESPTIQKAVLRVYNDQGILIDNQKVLLSVGENYFQTTNLIPGIYILQLQGESQFLTNKFASW